MTDDLLVTSEEEAKAAAERILANQGKVCDEWAGLYWKWIEAENSASEAGVHEMRQKLVAHNKVCGCRRVG